MVELVIIRHGQTIDNLNGYYQGHAHGELTALGREQAIELGRELRTEHFDCIYSSDLKRAYDTACLAFPDYHIITDVRLRERYLAHLQGCPVDPVLGYESDIEGCESLDEMRVRAESFLNDIRLRHKGSKIALVSHGVLIKILRTLIENKSMNELRIVKNCTALRFDI